VGGEVLEVFGPVAVIEECAQPFGRVDSEMVATLGADLLVLVEILVVDDLRAARAFHPESFGHAARFFACRFDRLARLLEPGHHEEITTSAGRNNECRDSVCGSV